MTLGQDWKWNVYENYMTKCLWPPDFHMHGVFPPAWPCRCTQHEPLWHGCQGSSGSTRVSCTKSVLSAAPLKHLLRLTETPTDHWIFSFNVRAWLCIWRFSQSVIKVKGRLFNHVLKFVITTCVQVWVKKACEQDWFYFFYVLCMPVLETNYKPEWCSWKWGTVRAKIYTPCRRCLHFYLFFPLGLSIVSTGIVMFNSGLGYTQFHHKYRYLGHCVASSST